MKTFFLSILSVVYALDCTKPENFPSDLRIGQVIPINMLNFSHDSDPTLSTTISGSMIIKSTCSLQLIQLTLKNAPASNKIQLYGFGGPILSGPINDQILSGDYSNQDGPTFNFYPPNTSPSVPSGMSFADFTSIRIYAVPSQWVIADIKTSTGGASTLPPQPTAQSNPQPVTITAVENTPSVQGKTTIVGGGGVVVAGQGAVAVNANLPPTASNPTSIPNSNSGSDNLSLLAAAFIAVMYGVMHGMII